MTVRDLKKLQSFNTSCPRKILRIFWPKISNNELKLTKQEDIGIVLARRRWIGHVLRKEHTHIPKVALRWTPEGKRKGRPKSTWRRTVEAELSTLNLNLEQALRLQRTDKNGGDLLTAYAPLGV